MKYPEINIFSPSKEHTLLREMVRRFAENNLMKKALLNDEKETFDHEAFLKLGELGLLGITAQEEYGGSSMDKSAAVIVHEELSFVDPGFCLAYLAHSMLCVNNIAQNGSEQQKALYLPKLCSGQWIGAMAMSEPHVGTDVLGMKTVAHKNEHGYVINGRKMWITNGAKDNSNNPADVLFIYAKTGAERKDVSSFIIEAGQKGYAVGQKLKGKLGMRASNTAEMVIDNCQLREDQLVGKLGDSMIHMMHNLEIERLTLAAMSLGIAKRCLLIMNDYASERHSFGKPLVSFGQIQKHIAQSYAKYKACRSYVYNTAISKTSFGRVDSDGAKLMASTMAKEVADSAIQVLGGYGYMSEYVVERLWRDAKLLEIGGGTIEAHEKNIAYDLRNNKRAIFE